MRIVLNAVGILMALTLVSSCDNLVYADAELKAQERFRSIKIGQTEKSLVELFGPPLGVATPTDSGLVLEGHTKKYTPGDEESMEWPYVMRFAPKRPVTGKILVYNEGTVAAYYFIDAYGRVEYVSVYIT